MAQHSDFVRAYLRAARLAADNAGQTLRELVESRLTELLSDGQGRTVISTSGAGSSVSFANGRGTEDTAGMLSKFLDVLADYEATYTTNSTLETAMLNDDRLCGTNHFRQDFSICLT